MANGVNTAGPATVQIVNGVETLSQGNTMTIIIIR